MILSPKFLYFFWENTQSSKLRYMGAVPPWLLKVAIFMNYGYNDFTLLQSTLCNVYNVQDFTSLSDFYKSFQLLIKIRTWYLWSQYDHHQLRVSVSEPLFQHTVDYSYKSLKCHKAVLKVIIRNTVKFQIWITFMLSPNFLLTLKFEEKCIMLSTTDFKKYPQS